MFSDKLFPALGFGAKVPPKGHVSHEIFLVGVCQLFFLETAVSVFGLRLRLLFS